MRNNPSLAQEQVYDQASWVTEGEVAATRRALEGVGPAVAASGDDALEALKPLLRTPGANRAAEAFTLVKNVARSCPKRAQTSVRALFREVRDVFVLHCMCQIEPKDHGNRDLFLKVVAKAFGPTWNTCLDSPCLTFETRKKRDQILHSHRMLTSGKPGFFQSMSSQARRRRQRRPGQTADDRELGQKINLAVKSFLEGEEDLDGASAIDEG